MKKGSKRTPQGQTLSATIEQVREVLQIEAEAILGLMDRIGPDFERAVKAILNAKGRVILTGIGKSGLIARKISATLNSTGTPSLFLHPVEAIHGDLGMVTKEDIVIAISNSGTTSEIITLLPMLKGMGARIISFTGAPHSPIALESDLVIDVSVEREACPMGLAPTASTTAALAMGDALAVVLIHTRRFSSQDFKRFHPGGTLGERLAVKVKEVMLTDDHMPAVRLGARVKDAMKEIDAKGIGATLVLDPQDRIAGIITDGDLRRALLKTDLIADRKVEEIMSQSPRTVGEDQQAAEALGIMELYGITHLCIVDEKKRVRGIVHLHDLLGREEFRLNGSFNVTRGLILDLVTPLKTDGELDEKGLKALLGRVLPHVQGILLAGPCGGEGEKLPADLREALLRRSLPLIGGAVPILVWVSQPSAESVKETVDLLQKRLKREKYRGEVFWVDTPLYYQGNRGLVRYYEEMSGRYGQGWVLHNDPELIRPTKRPFKRENIRTNILNRLSQAGGVEGLIFSGSLDRANHYQKAVRPAPKFRIYDGEESRFLRHPSLGGVVSLGANLMPKAWQKVTCSSLGLEKEEYPDRLRQIFEAGARVGELVGLYHRNPVPLVKQALYRMGILGSPFSFRGDADPQGADELFGWLKDRKEL